MIKVRMIQLNEGMKMQTSHLWNRKFQQSEWGGFEITSIDLNQNLESKLEYLSKPSPANQPPLIPDGNDSKREIEFRSFFATTLTKDIFFMKSRIYARISTL